MLEESITILLKGSELLLDVGAAVVEKLGSRSDDESDE